MPPLHAQKPLAAAEAGASISRLIEQVTRDPGKAVVIANENSEASAVLVDTLHYELLTHRAKQNSAIDFTPGEPFRLAGSMEILVSDDELEAGIAAERRRQAELAAAKFADL